MNQIELARDIQPPQNDTWKEKLRFYCQASPPDNPNLEFMASMWSYAIKFGSPHGTGLAHVERYYDRFINEIAQRNGGQV